MSHDLPRHPHFLCLGDNWGVSLDPPLRHPPPPHISSKSQTSLFPATFLFQCYPFFFLSSTAHTHVPLFLVKLKLHMTSLKTLDYHPDPFPVFYSILVLFARLITYTLGIIHAFQTNKTENNEISYILNLIYF